MTIRELYEWALEHQCEGYELLFTVEYPERSNVREDLLNGVVQYFIDEISECPITRCFPIHQMHEPQVDFAVVFQFSQRAVSVGHKSEKYGF